MVDEEGSQSAPQHLFCLTCRIFGEVTVLCLDKDKTISLSQSRGMKEKTCSEQSCALKSGSYR